MNCVFRYRGCTFVVLVEVNAKKTFLNFSYSVKCSILTVTVFWTCHAPAAHFLSKVSFPEETKFSRPLFVLLRLIVAPYL